MNIDAVIEKYEHNVFSKLVCRKVQREFTEQEDELMNKVSRELKKIQGMKIEDMVMPVVEGSKKLTFTRKAKLKGANKVRLYLYCMVKQLPKGYEMAKQMFCNIHNLEDHMVLNVVATTVHLLKVKYERT